MDGDRNSAPSKPVKNMMGRITITAAIFILFLFTPFATKALNIPFGDSPTSPSSQNAKQLDHQAHVAYDEGNYTEALFYAKQALRLDPKSSSLLTNLGSISSELGNYSGSSCTIKAWR